MSQKYKIIFIEIILVMSLTNIFAHSGRTDGNGGHYNRSTGEYHYHHGYGAHQHINGVCPYDNKEDTNIKKYSHNTNTISYTENKSNQNQKNNVIKNILGLAIGFWWLILPLGFGVFEKIKNSIRKK